MTNKVKTIWVLVADEAVARLYERPEDATDLVSVEEMNHPKAHARNAELRDDAYGRREGGQPASHPGSAQPQGAAATATKSAGLNESHQEAEVFARAVAERLTERLRERRYTELRIAAAPRFLGLLRKAMSPQVAATVKSEIDKQLIHDTDRELTLRFFGKPG